MAAAGKQISGDQQRKCKEISMKRALTFESHKVKALFVQLKGCSGTIKSEHGGFMIKVEDGIHCALIGTNGTGKSTLIDLLMHEEKYLYDGKVELEGVHRIGYVSQFSTESQKDNPLSRVAVFGFMNPVFGVILSAVLLDENDTPGLMSVVSLILVCIGIYIVNRESQEPDLNRQQIKKSRATAH